MGLGVRRDDKRGQLRFALLADELNSFFKPSIPSESRGHSQENELLAQLAALMRAACLTGLATGTGTFSVSLRSDACSTPCCTCCCCCCLAANAAVMVLRRWFSR